MCDWVLPWCFLANSASPLEGLRVDFKCAGSAFFSPDMVNWVYREVNELAVEFGGFAEAAWCTTWFLCEVRGFNRKISH